MAGAGNPSDRRIAVGRSQLVWRDPPVLSVGLPGCGPPILAGDRPICSMARGTAAFRKEVSDSRTIGQSYRDHVPAPHYGNTNTVDMDRIDRTAQAGVKYQYAAAAQRSNQDPPTGAISTETAYGQTPVDRCCQRPPEE